MKTLVAGFGNILAGDDGFGVEVVRRFRMRGVPECVEVIDVGIAGFSLITKLYEGFDRLIIVDAMASACTPGTVTTLTLRQSETADEDPAIDPHLAEPSQAMKLARRLNVLPDAIMVIGCEPGSCDIGIGLSQSVTDAVERVVDMIEEHVR